MRCYAIAVPGCVISEEGQPEMQKHVMSVVTRDDLVPRLSYHVGRFLSVRCWRSFRNVYFSYKRSRSSPQSKGEVGFRYVVVSTLGA